MKHYVLILIIVFSTLFGAGGLWLGEMRCRRLRSSDSLLHTAAQLGQSIALLHRINTGDTNGACVHLELAVDTAVLLLGSAKDITTDERGILNIGRMYRRTNPFSPPKYGIKRDVEIQRKIDRIVDAP